MQLLELPISFESKRPIDNLCTKYYDVTWLEDWGPCTKGMHHSAILIDHNKNEVVYLDDNKGLHCYAGHTTFKLTPYNENIDDAGANRPISPASDDQSTADLGNPDQTTVEEIGGFARIIRTS